METGLVAGIAAAALFGAVINGLFTNHAAKRSMDHAADMARRDREAAEAAAHCSAMRSVYAAYVIAGMTALRDITEARAESPTSSRLRELKDQARLSSHAVFIAYGAVALEGPPQVAKSAKDTYRVISEYWKIVAKRYRRRSSEGGAADLIYVVEPSIEAKKAGDVAMKALEDFMVMARATLND